MVGLALAALVLSGTWSAAIRARGSQAAPPSIGANYTHLATPGCSLDDTGIVAFGQDARPRIKRQLAAMRAAGLQTLRLLVWHSRNAARESWGIVPSTGGTLGEPYRTNLVHYLQDVRAAGFAQLTVGFAPEGPNAPLTYGPNGARPGYDPSTYDENWRFIQDVRPLIKRYGPTVTHIDLVNEGVPGIYDDPAIGKAANAYVTRLYADYVGAYGSNDVSFSIILADAGDAAARLGNLIADLRASGRQLPAWFDVHPAYTPDAALAGLRAADALLSQQGLSQPLVISESAYDDEAVAQAIAGFAASSAHRVTEVMEWPLTSGHSCPSPPFRAEAYIAALTGSPPPSTLRAFVAAPTRVSISTPYGQPVVALEAGTYTVTVKDSSRRADFHLVGPGVSKATTLRFRGTVTWTVSLSPGAYAFGSDKPHGKLRGSFAVLPAG